MNLPELKKQIIREGVIAGVAVIMLAAGVYFLMGELDDSQQSHEGLTGEVAGITAEKSMLESKYFKARENSDLFLEIQKKRKNRQLDIDREIINARFNEFRSRYHLGNLRLTMANAQELTGTNFKRPTAALVTSDVSVQFDALSDKDVYDFVQAVQDELTGAVKITSFTLKRQYLATPDAMRQISDTGEYAMVQGSLKFTWYGLKITEKKPGVP